MRLPRFRVRTLMIAVGVVALLIWGAMMGTRWYIHYTLARQYGIQERAWLEIAARDRQMQTRRIADYIASLARKHRRAMWHPWTPVPPDPPAVYWGPSGFEEGMIVDGKFIPTGVKTR